MEEKFLPFVRKWGGGGGGGGGGDNLAQSSNYKAIHLQEMSQPLKHSVLIYLTGYDHGPAKAATYYGVYYPNAMHSGYEYRRRVAIEGALGAEAPPPPPPPPPHWSFIGPLTVPYNATV